MLQRLSELKPGEEGVIQAFDDNAAKVFLLEMGCIPGALVRLDVVAPLGDPIAITIAGYCLSLRKKDAQHIWVQVAERALTA